MGFLRSKSKPPEPQKKIEDKLIPTPMPMPSPSPDITPRPPMGDIGLPVEPNDPETTQPGDEGKKSKKKNKFKGGTLLTSVTGVNEPANLGYKTLLG